jgi:hypothetical protein
MPTKQFFILLADAIREHNRIEKQFAGDFNEKHLDTLADALQKSNPRFNRERWLAYIAGESGPNGGAR